MSAQTIRKEPTLISLPRPLAKYRPPRPCQLLKCYPSQMVKPQKRYAMIRHLGAWH